MKKYDCFQLDSICFALFNLWTNPQRSFKLNYVTEEVIFWYLLKHDETGPALTSLTSNNCWTNASLSRNRMNVEPVQHAHVPPGWMLTTLGGQLPAVALVSWQPPLVTTFICTLKIVKLKKVYKMDDLDKYIVSLYDYVPTLNQNHLPFICR